MMALGCAMEVVGWLLRVKSHCEFWIGWGGCPRRRLGARKSLRLSLVAS